MSEDVGYIRVSSVEQNTARQLDGVHLDHFFTDRCSGKDINRPELKECMQYCRKGDTLHVHSIDRLARNLIDLQNIVETMNKKGVTVVFHKESMTFSTNSANPMNTLMLQMLGAFAQFERALIEERRKEGIAKAKAEGKYKGKQSRLTSWDLDQMKQMKADGVAVAEIARKYRMTPQGIYKALQRRARQDLAARQGGTPGQ